MMTTLGSFVAGSLLGYIGAMKLMLIYMTIAKEEQDAKDNTNEGDE